VKSSEPIFNVPGVLVALIAVFVLVHAGRVLMLSPHDDLRFLLCFAFIPVRYDASALAAIAPGELLPGGVGAEVWSFVTYAFLHADIVHLLVNIVWLLPFGAAVARRFGTVRFLLMFFATAAAGALLHLVTHLGELVLMIGASGAVSGFMAAAIRFAFQPGGPLENWRTASDASYLTPAAPLSVVLRNPRVLIFIVLWFGSNLLFGIGSTIIPGAPQAVAWQTHIGGFIAGLLLFPFLDPVGAAQQDDQKPDSDPTLH
jgi:membrane associated rhomboid family serine protease